MLHHLHLPLPTPAANSGGSFRCPPPPPPPPPCLSQRNRGFGGTPTALGMKVLCFSSSNSVIFLLSHSLVFLRIPTGVTAFAIQVHGSAFQRIRHGNDFRHFRFSDSPSGSSLHSPSSNFLASSQSGHFVIFLGGAQAISSSCRSFLTPCSRFASSFSLWYIHKSCSLSAICKASSVFLCTKSFTVTAAIADRSEGSPSVFSLFPFL